MHSGLKIRVERRGRRGRPGKKGQTGKKEGKQGVMEVLACQSCPLIHAQTDAFDHSKSQAWSINT